ncbi:MAG TPA: FHA domain-containing protein [Oligoflexia bacterium]|nr:FHA domain-containing protein [Oligoflexia bacterium]HMP49175.1 FHA domain-containing protein [Oligoflexia bacterium]
MGIKLTVMTLDIDPDSKPVTKVFQKDELTLGRLPSNDLVLNRPEISGIHARIRLEKAIGNEPAKLFITDLGSSNGTTVEKNHLRPRVEIPIMPNERIFIGNYVIKPGVHIDEAFSTPQVKSETDYSVPYDASKREQDEHPSHILTANAGSGEVYRRGTENTAVWQSPSLTTESVSHKQDSSRRDPSSSLLFASDRVESSPKSPIHFHGAPAMTRPVLESNKTREFISPFGKRPEIDDEEPAGKFHYVAETENSNVEEDRNDDVPFDSESDRLREEEEAARARAEIAHAEYQQIKTTHNPVTASDSKEKETSMVFHGHSDQMDSSPREIRAGTGRETQSGAISIRVKVDGSDVRSLNFVASAFVDVKGLVLHKGQPLAGVVVDAGSLGTAISQKDGSFIISKVLEGTSYNVKLSKERFILEPSEISGQAGFNKPVATVNAIQLFSISGVVTHTGMPLGGVEVDGGELGKTITREDGSYTFENVPEGREYSLSLYKEGYVFKN